MFLEFFIFLSFFTNYFVILCISVLRLQLQYFFSVYGLSIYLAPWSLIPPTSCFDLRSLSWGSGLVWLDWGWGGQGRRALPCGPHLILTSWLCSSNFPLLVLVQKKFRSSQVCQPWGLPVWTRLALLGPVDNLRSFGVSSVGQCTPYGTFLPILPAKAHGSHLSCISKCVAMITKMTPELGEKSLYKYPHPLVSFCWRLAGWVDSYWLQRQIPSLGLHTHPDGKNFFSVLGGVRNSWSGGAFSSVRRESGEVLVFLGSWLGPRFWILTPGIFQSWWS